LTHFLRKEAEGRARHCNKANTDELRAEIISSAARVDEATGGTRKNTSTTLSLRLPPRALIHGHGAGILRRGVREFRKSPSPRSRESKEAPQNEGAAKGATLVELRQ